MAILAQVLARFFAHPSTRPHATQSRHSRSRVNCTDKTTGSNNGPASRRGRSNREKDNARRTPRHTRRGARSVESLEDRYLLSVGVELNGGLFPVFAGNSANDALTIRVGTGGKIEYSANGSAFSTDLDSDPGVQSLIISSASRIETSLGAGNDALTLDFSGGNPVPAGGVNFQAGAGIDQVIAAVDTSFVLSNSSLAIAGFGPVTLLGVEQAQLTGGVSSNTIDASAFTYGSATLDGGSGNDTLLGGLASDSLIGGPGVDRVLQTSNTSQTLSNTILTGMGSDTLVSIEEAILVGGPGNNALDAATFSGPVTLDGGAGADSLVGGFSEDLLTGGPGNDTIDGGSGVDTVMETADADFTLTGAVLAGAGTDSLAAVEQAHLTGGAATNVFTVSDWNGQATLDGGGGSDRVVATKDVNFTLSQSLLSLSSGQAFSLSSIEEARLTGGAANNVLDASSFPGQSTLNGVSGNDSLYGGSGNDELTGDTGGDVLDGGAGTDTLVEFANADLTLTNTGLTGAGGDSLARLEQARLTGGLNNNRLDAASFSGPVTLDGGAGNDTLVASPFNSTLTGGLGSNTLIGGTGSDTIVESGDMNFILGPGNCTATGANSLISIERALLTGGRGANAFAVTGWTGTATLDGGLGDDRVISSNDSNFTLSNTLLFRASGGSFTLAGIESAQLTGGSTANVLNASAFTLGPVTLDGAGGDDTLFGGTRSDTLIGGAGVDRVVAAGDVSYVLTNTSLSGLGIDSLSGVEQASLTGGSGVNSFTIGSWTGQTTLDGAAGTDRLISSNNSSYTLTNSTFSQSSGGTYQLSSIEEAVLTGDGNNNAINASGFSGSTTLTGGAGHDTLTGGTGIDTLVEQVDANLTLSNSALTGGLGSDPLTGIERAVLTGGPGNNTLDASLFTGSVTLDGGNGSDSIVGGPGADVLIGGPDSSNDTLIGGAGTDTLIDSGDVSFTISTILLTGLGSDTLNGIEQARLIGGGSSNVFTVTGWNGPATLSGGDGDDQIVASNDANFTLSDTLLTRSGSDPITLAGFEQAKLTGGAAPNSLDASAFTGSCTLDGGGGSDTVIGGTGADQLTGGSGPTSDTLIGGAGTDSVVESGNVNFILTNTSLVGLGTDLLSDIEQVRLTGGSNGNSLNASAFTTGPVTLDGGAGGDTLLGGSWADVLIGGAGSDYLSGGAGTDTVRETADVSYTLSDTMLSGSGTDTLASVEQAELVGGSSSNVFTISNWTGRATLDGGAGSDRVSSTNDAHFTLNDTRLTRSTGGVFALNSIEEASLTGGAGANSLDASEFMGNATLDGASGNDTILGAAGDDSLIGGVGTDRLIAQADVDFTLSATDLIGLGTDALGGFEEVLLTGGESDNVVTISSYAGLATLDGGAGTDQIAATDNTNFTLTDSLLSHASGGTFNLMSFEQGKLTGGSGANTLNASGFSGPVTLDGGSGADSLVGGSNDDELTGGPGGSNNDTLNGGPGMDTLIETGDVHLTLSNSSLTGLGTDSLISIERATLIGGSSNKSINASSFTLGAVTIDGGAGSDTIIGGSADDVLTGNLGNDVINGGPGSDTLVEAADETFVLSNSGLSGVGTDSLTSVERAWIAGGIGSNVLDASSFSLGPVTLDGGSGNDTLTAGPVPCVLIGGPGNDSLNGGSASCVFTGGLGDDTMRGGSSVDTLVESGDANLTLSGFSLVGMGDDALSSVERVSLTGGDSPNTLQALNFDQGAITLDGGGGNDTIIGGKYSDVLIGGDGNDSISGQAGDDSLTGGFGDDTLDGGAGVNVVVESADVDFTLLYNSLMGAGTDALISIQWANLTGGPGDNRLDASSFQSGRVTLRGGAGNDTLSASVGTDTIDGGLGDDTYRFQSPGGGYSHVIEDAGGIDTLDFSTVDRGTSLSGQGLQLNLGITTPQSILPSTYQTITLASSVSIENVIGSWGNDNIVGNSLANTIFAGGGNDTVDGSSGNDVIFDGAGHDSVTGGFGNDVLYSVEGNDTVAVDGNDTRYSGLGDFNGDGLEDAVGRNLATGQWLVSLSTETDPLVTAWGSYDPAINWDEPMIGDFNGDGRDDIAGRDADGLVDVLLSSGSAFPNQTTWSVWSSGINWSDIRVGDFNGDGLDDLVARNGSSGDLLVSTSLGSGFDNAVWGRWDPASNTIVDVRVGDFSGDGREDLAARNVWPGGPTQDGTWQVMLSAGSTFTSQNWGTASAWTDIDGADINGDGRSDLIGYKQNSGWWSAISTGNSFVNQTASFLTGSSIYGVTSYGRVTTAAKALDAFDWVRNNIEYQPYPGLMKGTQATTETRAGNDWDQAALLLERLVQIGVNAQLVSGRIRFQSAAQLQAVQDWLGVTQLSAAINILTEAGLNVSTSTDINQNVLSITIDHAWVQAYLPGLSGNVFHNLDPSWKFKDYQAGLPDIVTRVPFDKAGFLAQPRPEIAYEYYQNQVIDYLARNLPGGSLGEIPHDGPIIVQKTRTIPPSPDYDIAGGGSSYDSLSVIPATKQHRVVLTLSITGGAQLFQQTLLVPSVSLERITISYRVNEMGALVPELRVDGTLIASGSAIAAGTAVELTVGHLNPGDEIVDQSFTYRRKAGQYLAVGLNAQQISDERVLDARRTINNAVLALDGEPVDPGELVMGGTLALAMSKYFHDVSQQSNFVSDLTHAKPIYNRVGSGIATSEAQVSYHWDLQIPVTPQGMGVDIPNNVYEPVPLHDPSIDFTSADQRNRLDIVGYNMSANEHAILQEMINTESISTVKGIQLAHASGTPVLTFSPGEIHDVSSPLHLSAVIEQSIENALNAGHTVMVPLDPITIHDWTGSIFIQQNLQPERFSLGYIIEDDLITQGGATTSLLPELEPPVPKGAVSQQFYAGDPVNPSNGNVFRDETDVSLASIGLPLQFMRHYDSQSAFDVGLGVGWLHNYGDSLLFAPSGDVTWIRSDGTRHVFEAIGQGAYDVPSTLHGSFTFVNGVYIFRNKDGTKHEFDTAGRLSSIADRNGNKLVITRNDLGQIDTVSDFFDASRRLIFSYSGEHITSVQDFTGRAWNYSYVDMTNPATLRSETFLNKVTGPSDATTDAAIVRYQYYSGGKLHGLIEQITEPDGGGHHYTYYPNRRAFEVTDAVGHSTALSYDLFRNVTTFTDERGATTSYEYDDNGLLLNQTNPDYSRETYTWQDFLMQSKSDALGNIETYEFFADGLGNLKRAVDRAGLATDFTYEPIFSNVTSITVNPGPQAQVTQFAYDTSGNVTQILDALGDKTTISYTGCSTGSRGQVCSRTDPKGNVPAPNGNYTTTFTYNNAGQVLTVATALPSVVINAYDSRGNLLTTTDPTGVQITNTYDLLGRRLTSSLPDPDGAGPLGPLVTATSYDPMGRPLVLVDPNGYWTSQLYDLKGERIQTVQADGTTVHYEFDEAGNQTTLIDELGRETEWMYDSRNRPVAAFYPDGTSTRTLFDPNGLIVARTDAMGHTTRSTYDPMGRILTTTDALGNSTINAYDAVGNLKATTDRRGATTTYTYDLLNRPIQVRGPEGFVSTTDYDPNGNVTRAVRYDITGLGDIPDDPRTLSPDLQRVQQTLYDIANRPIQQIDPLNNSSYISYDAAGRVKSRRDALNRISSTNYDSAGRVVQQVAADPDGAGPLTAPVTNYTLDAVGNILTIRDPLNHTTTSRFDPLNRLTDRYDAASFIHSYSFDPAGQLISEQDEAGRMTLYSYDQRGRRIRQIASDPDWSDGVQAGPVSSWSYDAAGHLLSETDSLGRVSQFDYDALGRRTRQTLPDPDGAGNLPAPFVTSVYDAEGGLIRSGDHQARTTVFINDSAGRAVQTTSPDPDGTGPLPAPVHSATFDALGNQIRTADTLGRITQYQYDALGRNTQITQPDPDGAGSLLAPSTMTAYDAVGNVLRITDPLGHATTSQYDGLNRRTREVQPDPDGPGPLTSPFTTFAYDAAGNLISSANALGETTSNEYDSLNRPVRVLDPRGAVTSYAYDPVGNRIRVTDPNGNDTTFVFDRLNRLVRETNQLGASRSFTYDAAGNQLTATDRNGHMRQFAYDALNRAIVEQWFQGPYLQRTINTTYDSAGRILSLSDPDSALTLSYDTLDRPITVSNAATPLAPAVTWTYAYDAAENKVSRSETINGQVGATETYSFDDLKRMTRVLQSGSGIAAKRVDLSYNAIGQFVSLNRSADLAGTQIVAQSSYSYDQANRLTSLSHTQGAISLGAFTYQFDAANRITRVVSSAESNGASSYSYDTSGQLTNAAHTFQANESYSYDATGNRASTGYQTATNNRLTSDGTYNYQYDAEGNRSRRTNITTGEYTSYTWDERNRLVRVTTRNAGGTVIHQVNYTYDALDRRISRFVDADGDGPGVTSREYFIFDDDDVALLYRDPDGPGSQPPALASRLLHGPAVDQVLADESAAQGLLWPLTDHEGTVRELVKRVTTTTESANHLRYDSFGRIISETAPAVDHLYSYSGRERDEATGLMNYRARWYDPGVGRFLSEDPAGFAAGDTNLSRYVLNNPINATDPSGLQSRTPIDELLGTRQFHFNDASGVAVTCAVCSDGSTSYFNKYTLAPGRMESTAVGDIFIEGDATITRIEVAKGTWSNYSDDLQQTGRTPGLWERISSSITKTLFPESEPDIVIHFSDGTRRIILGGGPTSGELAGQGLAVTGLISAAQQGSAGVARELLNNVIDTTFAETTGIPLPVSSVFGNTPSIRSKDGIGHWEASGYDASRITRWQLADNIDSITARSSEIAREIRSRNIGVNLLGDEMYTKAYQMRGGSVQAANNSVAFAFGDQMYLRRSSASILTDAVHEGTHVLDHLSGFSGTTQQWERRAWFAEREYLQRIGIAAPHPNSRQLMLDIWRNYPHD